MFFINGQNHRNVVSIHSTSLMRFLLWDFKISKTKISSTVFYEAHFLCHEDKQKKKTLEELKTNADVKMALETVVFLFCGKFL